MEPKNISIASSNTMTRFLLLAYLAIGVFSFANAANYCGTSWQNARKCQTAVPGVSIRNAQETRHVLDKWHVHLVPPVGVVIDQRIADKANLRVLNLGRLWAVHSSVGCSQHATRCIHTTAFYPPLLHSLGSWRRVRWVRGDARLPPSSPTLPTKAATWAAQGKESPATTTLTAPGAPRFGMGSPRVVWRTDGATNITAAGRCSSAGTTTMRALVLL